MFFFSLSLSLSISFSLFLFLFLFYICLDLFLSFSQPFKSSIFCPNALSILLNKHINGHLQIKNHNGQLSKYQNICFHWNGTPSHQIQCKEDRSSVFNVQPPSAVNHILIYTCEYIPGNVLSNVLSRCAWNVLRRNRHWIFTNESIQAGVLLSNITQQQIIWQNNKPTNQQTNTPTSRHYFYNNKKACDTRGPRRSCH